MASIIWRGDRQKWYAYFYISGKQTGTPIKTAPTRKELTRKERLEVQTEAERIADEHQEIALEKVDIGTATMYWLQDVTATKRMRTAERYNTIAMTFLRFMDKRGRQRITVRSVTMHDIRAYRDDRLKTHAASTVINDMKCLTAMFAWIRRQRNAAGDRLIQENPCEDVERPKLPIRRVVFPTDVEVRHMVDSLADAPIEFQALGLMGAFAGMRRGEIILLRWEWVDFEKGMLYVHGKSKYPRPVPIHPRIRSLLESLPHAGPMVLPSPYAATGQARSPFAARKFNNWLRAQGLVWTHHGLRRWFNDSLRLSPGLPASARRLVVGHEDEATNRLYQNPQAEEARPFVENLMP